MSRLDENNSAGFYKIFVFRLGLYVFNFISYERQTKWDNFEFYIIFI